MKVKSAIKLLANIVQVSLTIFALTIYYLSNEKMGVVRSLTYRNDVFDKLSLSVNITYGLYFTFMLFLINVVRLYIKNKMSNDFKYSVAFILLNLILIIFIVKFSSDVLLSYYVISISAFILLVIQVIKFNFL